MEKEKSAVLMVSFGASYPGSREKTIDKMEQEIRASFPEYEVYQAWTSKMILRHLAAQGEKTMHDVCKALEEMVDAGIRRLAVQPTHVLNGIENDRMKEDVLKYQKYFTKISFGNPLLTNTEDHMQVIRASMEEYPPLEQGEAFLWMGHGTAHYANSVYAALDYTFEDMGYHNVYVGTVEAYPSIGDIVRKLKETDVQRVHLAPFLLVAGDHANNDMAGDDKSSWKSVLEAAGYEVICHIRGLGEYPGIRSIYLQHLKEAMEGLRADETERK